MALKNMLIREIKYPQKTEKSALYLFYSSVERQLAVYMWDNVFTSCFRFLWRIHTSGKRKETFVILTRTKNPFITMCQGDRYGWEEFGIWNFVFVTFSVILWLSLDRPIVTGEGNRSNRRNSLPNQVTGNFLTCPRWDLNPDSGERQLAGSQWQHLKSRLELMFSTCNVFTAALKQWWK